jgi:hypothetical protein
VKISSHQRATWCTTATVLATLSISTLSNTGCHAMAMAVGKISGTSSAGHNGISKKNGFHSIGFNSQSSLSANGSVLIAGAGGNLVTSAGIWTFNSAQGNGGYEILLNRESAGGG